MKGMSYLTNKMTLLTALLLFGYSGIAKGKYPYIFDQRLSELKLSSDSLVCYIRNGSTGSISESESTGYIVYKENGKWVLEYYRWSNSSGKLINKSRNRSAASNVNSLFRFISKNTDSLHKYNGRDYLKEIITERMNDTASGNVIYSTKLPSHYASREYYIKVNNVVLSSKLTLGTIEGLLKEAPHLASLILVLNLFCYEYSFDGILDQP